jgi:hypothetical protein
VETNIISNFESIYDLFENQQVVHQIFMLDELKTEERLHYDDASNQILGPCHEHGNRTSLEYNSEKEIDLLIKGIDKGEVHVVSEVGHGGNLACDFS